MNTLNPASRFGKGQKFFCTHVIEDLVKTAAKSGKIRKYIVGTFGTNRLLDFLFELIYPNGYGVHNPQPSLHYCSNFEFFTEIPL